MTFFKTKLQVFNRGSAPDSFLTEMVKWAKTAPDEIFDRNNRPDIYNKVLPELGPWTSLNHRKAVMLEVMRVLAGFESSWDWAEGVDTSRLGADTPENSEAGAWQVSWNARHLAPELSNWMRDHLIMTGIVFQQKMKFNHPLAMEFIARLLRFNTRHNGPLYKDDERLIIRRSLREEKHSIYPWLSRAAVDEFHSFFN